MKFPILWHEESYRNWFANWERAKEELERKKASVNRMGEELQHYRFQIDQAKAKGKDGFDSDKFLKRSSGDNDEDGGTR